jgi:hypothetical protein
VKVRIEVIGLKKRRASGKHTARAQHSPGFAERAHRISDVLKNGVGNYVIERRFPEGKRVQIGVNVGTIPDAINADVAVAEVVADRATVSTGPAPPIQYIEPPFSSRQDREVATARALRDWPRIRPVRGW